MQVASAKLKLTCHCLIWSDTIFITLEQFRASREKKTSERVDVYTGLKKNNSKCVKIVQDINIRTTKEFVLKHKVRTTK
jgi:uncharacterized protein YdbL (DUF1318 family)